MKSLWAQENQQALDGLATKKSVLAFDFDGTLAPIVRDPEQARANDECLNLLRKLSPIYNVIILSGRSRSDLIKRIPIDGLTLIGNHGMETNETSKALLLEHHTTCQKWINQLKRLISLDQQLADLFIEDKNYSLAIHFRNIEKTTEIRPKIEKIIRSLAPPPRVVPGKSVVNLLPANAPNKGTALRDLLKDKEGRPALFVGDDDTDEDVFALSMPGLISIRVGNKKSSQAQFYINRQSEITRLLQTLLALPN